MRKSCSLRESGTGGPSGLPEALVDPPGYVVPGAELNITKANRISKDLHGLAQKGMCVIIYSICNLCGPRRRQKFTDDAFSEMCRGDSFLARGVLKMGVGLPPTDA